MAQRRDSNALEDRGESLFFLAATAFHGARPLFRPAALGSKWPTADYAVESGLQRLLAAAVPAYIVAVDEDNERVYVVRPRTVKNLTSASTRFSLHRESTRLKLREEVVRFWNAVTAASVGGQSAFAD